jgi:hypothetical protein
MSWPALFVFVPLAIAANTSLPVPFDPILIYFASRSPDTAVLWAMTGSLCAAVAAIVDLRFLSWVSTKSARKWITWIPLCEGRLFYLMAFLFTALPLPFVVIRLAMLRRPPAAVPYALVVCAGRLLRYLATVAVWPLLGVSAAVSTALLCLCLFAPVCAMRRTVHKDASTAEITVLTGKITRQTQISRSRAKLHRANAAKQRASGAKSVWTQI